MHSLLEYIAGIIHTKFQTSSCCSGSGKNSYIILRYRRFSEKGSKKLKNGNFLAFFFKEEVETYFSHSSTPNTSFYQVSSVFMKDFSFYGTKTISKWLFFDPKTPKNHTKKSRYLQNYMEFWQTVKTGEFVWLYSMK